MYELGRVDGFLGIEPQFKEDGDYMRGYFHGECELLGL
jgi:hypothetical protein